MELILGVNWTAPFVLTIALLFELLYWLSDRINRTLVILLSLVLGKVLYFSLHSMLS